MLTMEVKMGKKVAKVANSFRSLMLRGINRQMAKTRDNKNGHMKNA